MLNYQRVHGNSKKQPKNTVAASLGSDDIPWYSETSSWAAQVSPMPWLSHARKFGAKIWQRRTNSETYPKDSGQTKNSRVTFWYFLSEVASRFEWNLRLNKGRREVQSQCAHIGHHQRHMFKFCDDPCHDGTTGLETPGNVLLNPCPGRDAQAVPKF